MKKIYFKPEARTAIADLAIQILAGSPELKSTGYNHESEVLSRHRSIWDDENDDDED